MANYLQRAAHGLTVRLAFLLDALKCTNFHALRLLATNRRAAREYCSAALRRYDDLAGHGLPAKNPLHLMYEDGWATPAVEERVELPILIQTGGGMRLEELLMFAMVTRVLQPAKIFEIGTFMGRTTSVLRLNAPLGATVVTLDLPPDVNAEAATEGGIDTDGLLIKRREVGALLRQLGLDQRCDQVLCDSLSFDPEPHRSSVELGFIDGAHSRRHVENDTRKMAVMMASRGLVFWHDYGGKGRFRDLTEYLDRLSARVAIHRVAGTTLAWTTANELRRAFLDQDRTVAT